MPPYSRHVACATSNTSTRVVEIGSRSDSEVTDEFIAGAGALAGRIVPTQTLEGLVAAMAAPRSIILMVPAGKPVDDMLAALAPFLQPDDLVIDAGNAEEARRQLAELLTLWGTLDPDLKRRKARVDRM